MTRNDLMKLAERVHEQRATTAKLRKRVIKKGGRKQAPRLYKAYVRNRHQTSQLEDEYRKAKAVYKQSQRPIPLRLKAYHVAESLVGVMEQGGNNAGPKVSEIIRANGGFGPEPWCGDFVAYCYRAAGSKRVERSWASVRLLRGLAGITATSHPRTGDLVRFNFDHVGIFVRWIDDNTIETIEGNTGASGAVSDSKTGGDGVYRKRRNINLVRDFLAVHG